MKIEYDPQVDALYVQLRDVPIHDSIDVEPGVTVDRDDQGHIIGIEILDARERVGADPLAAVSIERLSPAKEPSEAEVA